MVIIAKIGDVDASAFATMNMITIKLITTIIIISIFIVRNCILQLLVPWLTG